MADAILDVGISLTPQSIREVQRDISAAFSQITPRFNADLDSLRSDISRIQLNFANVGITQGAINQLQNEVRRRVSITFDNIDVARAALSRLRQEVQQAAQVSLETQQRAQQAAVGAGARPELGSVSQREVEQANQEAAQAAQRLANAQARLAAAEEEFARNVAAQNAERQEEAQRLGRALQREAQEIREAGAQAAISLGNFSTAGVDAEIAGRLLRAAGREAAESAREQARVAARDATISSNILSNKRDQGRAIQASARQTAQAAREESRAAQRVAQVDRNIARRKERQAREIEALIGNLRKSARSLSDVQGAEQRLEAELRRRIANERRAGRLPGRGSTGVGLSGAGSLGRGDLSTREFERLQTVLRQLNREARSLEAREGSLTARTTRLSGSMRDLAGNVRATRGAFRRAGNSAIGFRDRVFRATQTVLAFAGPSALIFGLVNAFEQATRSVIELDRASRRLIFFEQAGEFISSATNSLNSFRISSEQITNTTSRLLSISERTGIAVEQISEALVTVTRVGQRADSVFGNTVISLLALEEGALNAEQAVRLLNAIQIQFLNSLNRFDPGIADRTIGVVGRLIETTAARSAFNVEQLSNALTRIGPALANIQGATIEQSIAVIGQAANATGADVGRLSTLFRQLTTFAIQNAATIRDEFGVDLVDAQGQVRGFEAIIEVLEELNRLAAAGSPRAIQLALEVADRRNIASAQALAANVGDIRREFEAASDPQQRIARAGREAAAVFEAERARADSLDGAVERLRARFTEFLNSPDVKDFLIEVIDRTGEFIQVVGRGISTIREFANAFGLLERGGASREATDSATSLAEALERTKQSADEVPTGVQALNNEILSLQKSLLLLGAELPFGAIGIFRATEEQRELNKQAQNFTDEQLKIIRATDARLRQAELLNAQEDSQLATARRNALLREDAARTQSDIIVLTERLSDEELSIADILNTQARLSELIARREAAVATAAEKRKENEFLIRNAQLELVRSRAEEESRLQNIEALQKNIAGFITGGQLVDLEFRVNQDNLDRQIALVEEEISTITLEARLTGEDDLQFAERIAELRARQSELEQQRQRNILQRQREITDLAFERANAQIRAWEEAANSVASAFGDVLGLQQGLAELVGRQGEIASNQLQEASQSLGRFLESTGASIEARLQAARQGASRQIQQIRRTGEAQLASLTRGADIEPFIDVDDVQADADQVVNILRNSFQLITDRVEGERLKQIRDTENNIRRIRANNAQQEFGLRIRRTRAELEIRSSIIEQEISVLRERINVERELNELRRRQQEEFGRLLVESPERFRETINDIAVATRFFRGVTDINIDSLRTISSRIQRLRGGGQVGTLQRILRGIQAGQQFGREIIPGVGGAQLQSIFERLQIALPESVRDSLVQQQQAAERQTEIQRRLEERQKIQEAITRFDIVLQEQQLRIASTGAEIARRQRDRIIAILDDLKFSLVTEIVNLGGLIGFTPGELGDPVLQSLFGDSISGLREFLNTNQQLTRGFSETIDEVGRFKEALEKSVEIQEGSPVPGAPRFGVDEVAPGGLPQSSQLLEGAQSVFERISQSLRPGRRGLRLVDPRIAELQRVIESTGGTTNERRLLRRLERISERTFRGTEARQGRRAAGRILSEEGTARDITQAFRRLLQQDPAGGDTDFVRRLREFDEQRRVDPVSLTRFLGEQGLGGVASTVSNRGDANRIVDRLLDLSEELTKSATRVTRDARLEIQRIVGQEIAEGIRDLNSTVIDIQNRAIGAGEDVPNRDAALVEALNNFNIAAPEQAERLSTVLRDAFRSVSDDVGEILGERFKAAAAEIEGTELVVRIPESEEFNVQLNVNLAGAITAEQFAEELRRQLSSVITNKAELDRVVRQIRRIQKPLVEAGLITVDPVNR